MMISRRVFGASLGMAGLAPQGGGVSRAAGGIRAGAATACITPHLGVRLGGPIAPMTSVSHVHDDLFARCLALEAGGTPVAIVVCDLKFASAVVFDEAKRLVREHAGLPGSRVLIASTHTHSAPRVIGAGQDDPEAGYVRFAARRIADSVRLALNRLAPARVGWGFGSKPEMVFNRRWFMKPGAVPANPFGERNDQVRMNPVDSIPDLVKPAGPADPEVAVLSVQHADGRPLALLANYGLHYVGGFRLGDISADYFGMFATRVAGLLQCADQDPPFVAIMSNGASGDVAGVDWSHPPPPSPDYARMRVVADALAAEVLRVRQTIEHRGETELAMVQQDVDCAVRRPDASRLAWAREIWATANSKDERTLGRSEKYAREAVLLAAYPPVVALTLQALRIGELAIASCPCEVFAETGLAIKRESPLRCFVIELANDYRGYLPPARHHALGGYETWPARSSHLEVAAEEKIRTTMLGLLRQV